MKSFILLVSGPSGAGKSTLLKKLFQDFKDEIYFSVSSTTRSPRAGEINGVHYYFVSEQEFKQGIENNEFLEWANVHGCYYGTSFCYINEALKQGKIVILDIDVQGFHLIKDKLKEKLVSIFITTQNKNELKQRLIKRNTDTIEILEKRLCNAKDEMQHLSSYDYVIINKDLQESYNCLKAIYESQKCKTKNNDLENILIQWNKGE
ncbi:guanylate kinase [Campylobacter sp. US33a]|uniref:guanylate kinase n=1 Tax=Campylobacter sp. US33a TaxID=2498120 RepID=UPI001068D291|nr:guanylate kinase [Campylobacter sp. US33a]TEY02371.1 guanylate kinase [Campylobacter sp. US33a]